jgi:hypothetical protein
MYKEAFSLLLFSGRRKAKTKKSQQKNAIAPFGVWENLSIYSTGTGNLSCWHWHLAFIWHGSW